MVTRLRECDEAIAGGRLRKAEQFLDAVATVRDLAERAGYAAPPVSAEQRKRAWRRAERLVVAAR